MMYKIILDNQDLSRGVPFLCTRSGRLGARSASFAELISYLDVREGNALYALPLVSECSFVGRENKSA